MPVQTGAEPVDEGDCANVQGRLVYLRRTGAARLQALGNDPQMRRVLHEGQTPRPLQE